MTATARIPDRDPIRQFRDAMAAAGIHPPEIIEADGKLHRFHVEDDRQGSKNAWYVLFPDSIPAGAFGCWKRGIHETWCTRNIRELSDRERADWNRKVQQARDQHEAETRKVQTEGAQRAKEYWEKSVPCTFHPYLTAKQVRSHGVRSLDELLVIPLRDATGDIRGIQYINPKGEKRFTVGTAVVGSYYPIGLPNGVLYVCEGYATGASIHEITGHAVAVAFNAGNLLPVARALRAKFPDLKQIICADDDAGTEGNPGLTQAREAAEAVDGLIAVPDFGPERPEGATDFNDLHRLKGAEAVRRCVEAAKAPADAEPESGDDAAILRLARLPPLEYGKARRAEAEKIGVPVSILDRAVNGARAENEKSESDIFHDLTPWPEAVNGADLLNDLTATISRYAILPKHGAELIALWITFSHCIDAVSVAPILAITSPEKRCGKTTLLDLISRLCFRPLPASNISPAAIYRAIEKWSPTLLIDEADSFLRDNNELRGILNSGHTRATAFVIRTVGDDFEPKRFSTWGAKAIALIGALRDTLADRAINIEMRRKLPDESCEKLRHADPQTFETQSAKARRFATDNVATLRAARPCIPDALNDRAADSWEPLMAIADIAGGDWPDKARKAALNLSGEVDASADSLRVQLMADIRIIFADKGVDRIPSADLIEALAAIEDHPWADYRRGRAITQRQLAGLLRGFRIVPSSIWMPEGRTPKGYCLSAFTDAFARFLPHDPPCRQNVGRATVSGEIASAMSGPALRIEKQPEALPGNGSGGIADQDSLPVDGAARRRTAV